MNVSSKLLSRKKARLLSSTTLMKNHTKNQGLRIMFDGRNVTSKFEYTRRENFLNFRTACHTPANGETHPYPADTTIHMSWPKPWPRHSLLPRFARIQYPPSKSFDTNDKPFTSSPDGNTFRGMISTTFAFPSPTLAPLKSSLAKSSPQLLTIADRSSRFFALGRKLKGVDVAWVSRNSRLQRNMDDCLLARTFIRIEAAREARLNAWKSENLQQ